MTGVKKGGGDKGSKKEGGGMTSGVKRGVGLTKGVEEGGTGGIKNYSLQTSRKFRKIAKTKAMRKFLMFRGEHVQVQEVL